MKIILNNGDLVKKINHIKNLGFVTTMRAIHKCHILLIKKKIKSCNKTLVSIFVNPKQFDNKADFKKYPKRKYKDISILRKLKIDYIFMC